MDSEQNGSDNIAGYTVAKNLAAISAFKQDNQVPMARIEMLAKELFPFAENYSLARPHDGIRVVMISIDDYRKLVAVPKQAVLEYWLAIKRQLPLDAVMTRPDGMSAMSPVPSFDDAEVNALAVCFSSNEWPKISDGDVIPVIDFVSKSPFNWAYLG